MYEHAHFKMIRGRPTHTAPVPEPALPEEIDP